MRTPSATETVRATRLAFGLAGALIAAWAPLVPYARTRLALDEAGLGTLLLCLGLGSVATMPFAGGLGRRIGARRLLGAACVLAALVLPSLAWLERRLAMAAALLVFGAALGLLDVAANLQASEIERRTGRPLMSGFHGAWSIGTIVGGGLTSLLLAAAGLPAPLAATVVTLLAIALAQPMMRGLPDVQPAAANGTAPAPARTGRPTGRIVLLAAMCMTVYLVEHAVLDWRAVFMTTRRGTDAASAGWAYTVFAAAMTAGRLGGDRLRAALGDVRLVVLGGTLGCAGLALVVGTGSTAAAMLGHALLGLGASNIVPVLFSAAGRDTAWPEGRALATVASVAFFGALGGPALIGGLAHATSLDTAFLVLALGLLAVAAGGTTLAQRTDPAAPNALETSP